MTILWPNGKTTPPPFSWQGHFGWRDADLSYASRYHRGQDFYGFSTVCSVADGTVVHVGRRAGWAGGGYMVWIQHDEVFSRSLHLEEGSATVSVGDHVSAGDDIGQMGNTNAGGVAMAVHLHLEITPGQWHAYNSGQIDPREWLEANVSSSGSGGGGGTAPDPDPDPTTPTTPMSEEDEMILVRVHDWKGRHYAIGNEYIKQIKDKDSVKAYEDATGKAEIPVSKWTFDRIAAIHGIPSKALNDEGQVLNADSSEYVYGGAWSVSQEARRFAWLSQK